MDHVDHRNVNVEVEFMRDVNPTTETLVVGMWRQIEPALPGDVRLVRLKLWETENNFVEYDGA